MTHDAGPMRACRACRSALRPARALAALALLVLALVLSCSRARGEDAAPTPTLVLDHATLTGRARKGLREAAITYTTDPKRVVIRGYRRRAGIWWPLRIEAVFVREAKRVRLSVRDLFVRGTPFPSLRSAADEQITRLVNEETDAARVEIRRGARVVYAQDLPERPR